MFQFTQAKSVLLTAQLSAALKADAELTQAVLAHAILKQPPQALPPCATFCSATT